MAAVLQSPSLPGNGEKQMATSLDEGRNTLISQGGRWHNVTSASDKRVVNGRSSGSRDEEKTNGDLGARSDGAGDDRGRMIPAGTAIIEDRAMDGLQRSGFEDADIGTRHEHSNKSPFAGSGVDQDNLDGELGLLDEHARFQNDTTQRSPAEIYRSIPPPLLQKGSVGNSNHDTTPFAASESSEMASNQAATLNLNEGRSNKSLKGKSNSQSSGVALEGFSNAAIPHTPVLIDQRRDNFKPPAAVRTVSTPSLRRRLSAPKVNNPSRDTATMSAKQRKQTPVLRFQDGKAGSPSFPTEDPEPSPMPRSTIPIPPMSLPTYLQLELSSHRPSSMYIHRSATSDFPYETSRVKLERLMNFLILPPQLEQILGFGALACLDSWLYSFTILPLRFLRAVSLLGDSWSQNLNAEVRFIGSFIYSGIGRMWQRNRRASLMKSPEIRNIDKQISDDDADRAFVPTPIADGFPMLDHTQREFKARGGRSSVRRHRRKESTPSALLPDHKADILKGLLIIFTCVIMMFFDPSRMYHGIRGQAAIKLYVIYNVLEVCDRLFSALGQDILECLFSKETLERKSDGHSKVLRPFGLFILALIYNLIHATALFYQVITLNVAVNSYSNALLTLLMSNQFVEIKSTVFKKFEKENLFQITCADVVERFQLWLMLTIIASRNIVETGSLMPTSSIKDTDDFPAFLPKAFNLEFTPLIFSAQVVGPYFIVLGSEMIVDWLKHAYITKFNMIRPAIYGRFLDVMCKDYYSNAFATQNLTRRLGLPVIPLACLFIRASLQTYQMFLATRVPSPLPQSSSAATSIAVPAPTALFPPSLTSFLDSLIPNTTAYLPFTPISSDALLTILTSILVLLLSYLTLLALKLLLGMGLLHFARNRYRSMKEREGKSFHAEGRRVGGWGVVEVDDDKKRWIYADDPEGLKKGKERETHARRQAAAEGGGDLSNVDRYAMVAKRIW